MDQKVSIYFQSILKSGGNEDYQDFLANTLNLVEIKQIYEALRKRSFRKSIHILNLINEKEETITIKSISLKEKLDIISDNDGINIKQINQIAKDHNKTNVKSYLSLFDSNLSYKQEKETNCIVDIESRKNCIDNSFMTYNKNLNSSISNKNDLYSDFSFSNSSPINKFKRNRFNINSKFVLDSKQKDRSPSPSNISKLNIFRNIFDDELQSFVFNNNGNNLTDTKSKREELKNYILKPNFQSFNKFHKLNDLVSVMINEEYFKA